MVGKESIMARCIGCGNALGWPLIDLGSMPLANAYVSPERADIADKRYPLAVKVCRSCLLAQVEQTVSPGDVFADYAYYSSCSDTWVAAMAAFAEEAAERFRLGFGSSVIEIGSNDGYLLRHFREMGVTVQGIDPAETAAAMARRDGIPTEVAFFNRAMGKRYAVERRHADLVVAVNVLAHVPDINDFVAGLWHLLKPDGVLVCEFPHLLNLIRHCQFDTIYHEHVCYLSLLALMKLFVRHGLQVFDVERTSTHGGSLRVFARLARADVEMMHGPVGDVLSDECDAKLDRAAGYRDLEPQARAIKDTFLLFLHEMRGAGNRVGAYGAAAKGNTFLNYCGIDSDLIEFVADRSPGKQGKLMPGSRIPIVHPDEIDSRTPDFVVILPWNLADEIADQLANSGVRDFGCQFVTAMPELRVW
jgi:SAM-dependent methyltransferase